MTLTTPVLGFENLVLNFLGYFTLLLKRFLKVFGNLTNFLIFKTFLFFFFGFTRRLNFFFFLILKFKFFFFFGFFVFLLWLFVVYSG